MKNRMVRDGTKEVQNEIKERDVDAEEDEDEKGI